MKTGNKNQAVILSIVAVAAIAFMVVKLLPARVKNSLGVSAGVSTPAAQTSVSTNLPLMLVGDPFSHPKLAVKPVVTDAQSQPPRDINAGNAAFNPGKGFPNPITGSISGSGTAENAGISRQKQRGPQITVLAVMHAETRVAELQVAKTGAKTYSENDLLAPGVRLVTIGDSFVEVRVNGVLHKIPTGATFGADDGDKK